VLVVEDDEINRDLLVRRLRRKGFNTIVAVDGVEAVAKAASESPDIILMDMSLPEMDGWEATRRIKDDPRIASIPIVALTAHASPSDRKLALQVGCDEFETKPVDFVQLVEKMQSLLAARGQVAS
jgi:CheY-like chemotaxis protein